MLTTLIDNDPSGLDNLLWPTSGHLEHHRHTLSGEGTNRD
jgi:hypothetical protein